MQMPEFFIDCRNGKINYLLTKGTIGFSMCKLTLIKLNSIKLGNPSYRMILFDSRFYKKINTSSETDTVTLVMSKWSTKAI